MESSASAMEPTSNIAKIYLLQEDREKSFKHWPFTTDKQCSIQKMAEAGFYWHGTDIEIDIAACFVCGKELDGWEESDDPWSEHRKHAPQCPFVKYGRAEANLTCEEFVNLMMATLKMRFQNNYTTLKTNGKMLIEKKRKEMEKLLRTN
ncbi:baculoviral IAP repeat-containing protein 5 [Anopheles marshallii]|uniref:baculoviral IAP repeat-containing protein 5 n=1 Tax=Anopheles marshallii TaxID=1521116 RepID=UPI00237A90A0|nr:baculoviral IAP repeat-containing protein 5 [Anopheles marshallii]